MTNDLLEINHIQGLLMKVFLTGATGNIGSIVAEALLANGHGVIGLARSDESAVEMQNLGIAPHRGNLHNANSIIHGSRKADAVIHTAWSRKPDMVEAEQNAVNAILEALDNSGKPFVYTSGMMMYGDTEEQVVDENNSLNTPEFLSWRVPIEQSVLNAASRNIRTTVIRPSLVYGRGRGFIAMQIHFARQAGSARCPGTGKNRWSTVHVEALADLYVRVLEKAPAGTVFNAATKSVQIKTLMEAVSRTAGADGKTVNWDLEEARQVLGPFADALWMNLQVSAAKAMHLLGWYPQAASVLEEIAHGSYSTNQ